MNLTVLFLFLDWRFVFTFIYIRPLATFSVFFLRTSSTLFVRSYPSFRVAGSWARSFVFTPFRASVLSPFFFRLASAPPSFTVWSFIKSLRGRNRREACFSSCDYRLNPEFVFVL